LPKYRAKTSCWLVGRLPPPVDQYGGRGLWLVNQLCDLAQIRSSPDGTVVRVRMQLDAAA